MLRLTFPHRFDFGADAQLVGDDLGRPDAWDRLRLQTGGAFAMATTASGIDASALIEQRARSIASLARGRTIASYGVGGANLEVALARFGATVEVTDYAPRTVEQLRRVAPSLSPTVHDLRTDGPLAAGLHLFHRIDTEFSNEEWRRILRRFAEGEIVVVSGSDTSWRALVHEAMLAMRRATRCGWARTAAAQEALWRTAHRVERLPMAGADAWLLLPS